MAKLKLNHNLASGEIDKAADDNQFSTYMGPPLADNPGVYRGLVKGINYKKSTAGHPMFMFVVEVKEPKGSDKAIYNGAAIFHNVMLPIDKEDKNFGRQAANIKEILQAIDPRGVAWKGYIADDFTVTSDDTPKVMVIGKHKHNPNSGAPVKFIVRKAKDYTDKEGKPKQGGAEIRSINALLDDDASTTGPSIAKGSGLVVEEEDDEDTGITVQEDEFEEDEVEDEPVKPAAKKKAAPRKKVVEPEPEEDEEDEAPEDDEELTVVELEDEDDEDEPEEEPEPVKPAPKKRVVRKKPAPEPEPEEDEDEDEVEDESDEVEDEPEAEPEPPRRRRRASTFADEED